MLSRMFQRLPFEDSPMNEKRHFPFHFVWNRNLKYVFPSSFHLRSDEIAGEYPEAAELIAGGEASAVVTEDGVLVDRVTPIQPGDTFGVCVAQRRKRGQVWLALAGVTGAATFVAAKLAKSLSTRLQEKYRSQDSDVYWAVIRARVPKDDSVPFVNLRQFDEETIVSGLQRWEPETGPAD